MTYYYDDSNGHHVTTLKKGAPEWCNHDNPDIWSEEGGMLANGLIIEGGSEDELMLVCNFIYKSAVACYKKYYPQISNPENPKENGYLSNFITSNLRFKDLEWLHHYAPWTKEYADQEWEARAKKLQRRMLEIYAGTAKFHSITDIRND